MLTFLKLLIFSALNLFHILLLIKLLQITINKCVITYIILYYIIDDLSAFAI